MGKRMATPKRGPIKIDLSDGDCKVKIDFEWCPLMRRYIVRIGKRTYEWNRTEFVRHLGNWLVRQQK